MWAEAAANVDALQRKVVVGYPGFAGFPPDPSVANFNDLVKMASRLVDRPTVIAAQSMGGIIAVMLARDFPQYVTQLILVATSGGVGEIASTVDWRAWVRENLPDLPDWFLELEIDLTDVIRKLDIPALLIWGDADAISPIEVGQRLQRILPRATLQVLPGADHDLINTRAGDVSRLIDEFLR